ncbi:hypothetical protein AGLY_008144 [Aphis glycines]|uniref:Uncharacterized protein n=1 Tax=Aphis glycines TaxID=307491 RepID=A0A6G0TL00_APHGL|nr:hypothetical protein AGLY_008144 [Aphis glycines]
MVQKYQVVIVKNKLQYDVLYGLQFYDTWVLLRVEFCNISNIHTDKSNKINIMRKAIILIITFSMIPVFPNILNWSPIIRTFCQTLNKDKLKHIKKLVTQIWLRNTVIQDILHENCNYYTNHNLFLLIINYIQFSHNRTFCTIHFVLNILRKYQQLYYTNLLLVMNMLELVLYSLIVKTPNINHILKLVIKNL